MQDQLARQNRKVQPIIGDGNCFFRAISYIIYSSQEQHRMVRSNIVDYIAKNSKKFSPYVITKKTIEERIANMCTPGEWATQVEIQAATEVYSIFIYLYTLTPTKKSYH